ncbi:MAG TPA: BlaI/MecI/CopY family transcriptional regulator [Terriglobales bacterium]|nr:BlaI/MecI/CopY family transcriptional regulator [Terriglobales bacterium]
MTSRSGAELPQLELECLAALWALERAPVAEVHARLASRGRPLAYTTILTVLDRLRRKRVVERERRGRAFVYTPLVTREQMRERALARLVSNYFDSRGEFERYLGVDAASAPLPRAVPVVAEPEPALLD